MALAGKKDKPEGGSGRTGAVKWVVIGVLGLAFMVLFQDQLGQLLGRVEQVEISKEGIMETPLGQAVVSNVVAQPSGALVEGIHGTTYVSRKDKFKISWPDNVSWNVSDTLGEMMRQQYGFPSTLSIPIVINKNEAIGNFRPNVNVVVESLPRSMSAREYLELNKQQMIQQGWTILSSSVDDTTQGGFMVFLNNSGRPLYQFQRYAIAGRKGYVVTAAQLPPENMLTSQLRDDLRSILNSFQLIS